MQVPGCSSGPGSVAVPFLSMFRYVSGLARGLVSVSYCSLSGASASDHSIIHPCLQFLLGIFQGCLSTKEALLEATHMAVSDFPQLLVASLETWLAWPPSGPPHLYLDCWICILK